MKVIYLASGKNKNLKKWQNGDAPSNAVYGFNFLLQDKDVDFAFLNIAECYQGNIFKRIFKRFVLVQNINKYDVVISQQYLDLLLFKFLLRSKNKWVVFNINLYTVLSNSNKLKAILIVNILRLVDLIINLSAFQQNFLSRMGINDKKMGLVKFGVDDYFYQKNNEQKNYILSVGLDAGRDFKTLVEAISSIDKKVIIISPQKNLKEIKKFPANLRIINKVNYLDLRKYYANAQFIIVPSRVSRKIGSDCSGQTVILEALASGKPVIANYKEWMKDYGLMDKILIFQNEDPADLKEKIKLLLTDKVLYNKLSYEGRIIIEKKFSSKIMIKKIKEILLNLVDQKI